MWLIPLLLILLLPACAHENETNTVIDFADSVKIVRELLQSNSLNQILENPEPEQLDFLINNFIHIVKKLHINNKKLDS